MTNIHKTVLILLMLTAVILTGCGAAASAPGPEKAVETYLTALVNQDNNRLATASCKDWAEKAQLEADSFQAVKAKLDGMVCTKTAETGDSATVTCTGKIIATYGNENQEIPLDRRPYQVVKEGGEWRMCGYAK